MEIYIILALVLALLQIWIIPMVLNLENFDWLISNREEQLDDSPVLLRSRKAYANLLESLPAFLALALNDVTEPLHDAPDFLTRPGLDLPFFLPSLKFSVASISPIICAKVNLVIIFSSKFLLFYI